MTLHAWFLTTEELPYNSLDTSPLDMKSVKQKTYPMGLNFFHVNPT